MWWNIDVVSTTPMWAASHRNFTVCPKASTWHPPPPPNTVQRSEWAVNESQNPVCILAYRRAHCHFI